MTDRITRLTVVLESDIREDDIESLVDAIRCMRCVASVGKDVRDCVDYDARKKVRMEVSERLMEIVRSL